MPRLFVPGRLCLLGEHSDWAGALRTEHPALAPGRCLVAGTDQGLHADVGPLPDTVRLTSVLPDGSTRGPLELPARAALLGEVARGGGFFSYAAGVAAEVTERFGVGGLRIDVTAADLPLAKGLSSSAAICVLVARAYGQVHDLGLSVDDEMALAFAGERRTGSLCGRMDQICAWGRRPVLLTFDGPTLGIEPLVPGASLHLLVVDLRGRKDTRRILADLARCYPDTSGALAGGVREALGPRNVALVARARAALQAGHAEELGGLFTEAQDVFDHLVAPACAELAAPRLHTVLNHPATRELAWGGKGVGSQGDGCAQLLTRGPAERDALATILRDDLHVGCLRVTLAAAV